MDLKSGYPYFLMKNGLGPDYEILRSDTTTDVVILGGGITGAFMAHALSRRGIACIVIDKRSIGLGSTSASTSLLQYEIDVPLHLLSEQIGKENAQRAYKLCNEAIDLIKKISAEVGCNYFNLCSSLYFSQTSGKKDYLKKEYSARKEAGFNLELVEEADLERHYGLKAKLAILSSRAATIDAYLLTHKLYEHNLKLGLKVFENTKVVEIKESKDRVSLKTDDGHLVSARHLVYATGFEVTEQITKSIVSLKSTYAFVSEHSEVLPPFFKNTVLWNVADPYLYMREDKGRLIVGGRDENYNNPEKRGNLLEKKTKKLGEDFNEIFPHIPISPQFSWAGTFGSTKDGLPYIGAYSKKPNSYFALGFGGNGITFSALAAEMIAEEIMGTVNAVPPIFSFDR